MINFGIRSKYWYFLILKKIFFLLTNHLVTPTAYELGAFLLVLQGN